MEIHSSTFEVYFRVNSVNTVDECKDENKKKNTMCVKFSFALIGFGMFSFLPFPL